MSKLVDVLRQTTKPVSPATLFQFKVTRFVSVPSEAARPVGAEGVVLLEATSWVAE